MNPPWLYLTAALIAASALPLWAHRPIFSDTAPSRYTLALGGRFISPEGEPLFFHEPVTGTDSWILIETTVRLPATGRYYVVAYPDDATPPGDKLWMAIGTKERFGLADLLNLGKIKRFVRSFHEVQ
jgi:hypothetical protein